MKLAVMMDTSDPNDIQQEYIMYQARAKKQDQARQDKMRGFLLTDKGL